MVGGDNRAIGPKWRPGALGVEIGFSLLVYNELSLHCSVMAILGRVRTHHRMTAYGA
jgi:hypothetical protein